MDLAVRGPLRRGAELALAAAVLQITGWAVREPEDERRAERGRRHRSRVLPSLERNADDRGDEKRPVDGCSETEVVASERTQ